MNLYQRQKMAAWTLVFALAATAAIADPPAKPPAKKPDATLPPALAAEANRAIDRALAYLESKQDDDGHWTDKYGPAVTAIVARAFAQDPRHGPEHPVVKRAVRSILKYQQPDGGLYDRHQNLGNYQTAVTLMFFAALDDPELKPRMGAAQAYLTKIQYDAGESVDSDNAWYGGAGYGKTRKRPDLSNTQMMLEALHSSGLPKSDPVYQRAVKFVSRCQMLGSTNDQAFARGATEGGFIYSPNAGGESKAIVEFAEGDAPLRCYGSMTYAGFKSMLYANVRRDDPRVVACLNWIRRNYTLDSNANMPGRHAQEGLYYYYYVFAKALQAWGEPVITDAAGTPHNWRIELCRKLISLQQSDGSWINERDRWLESDPNYVTGLTVISMQTALQQQAPPAATK